MAVGLQPTDFEKQLDVLRGTPGITEEAIGEALLSRLGGTSQEAALANVTAILQAHGTGFLAPEQADMLLAAAYAQLNRYGARGGGVDPELSAAAERVMGTE